MCIGDEGGGGVWGREVVSRLERCMVDERADVGGM